MKIVFPVGEENAVTMSTLAAFWHVDDRAARRRIELLRRNGEVICSSDRGYFRPANVGELRRYVRRSFAGIKTRRSCLKGAEALLADVEAGRIKLGDF